ncbi:MULTISPECIES: hypothetical protein [Dietzia]|jgi:hypothetical protein|uniref:Uncharacterized protein n=1 Tax=Dietzia maris TaxID=37915 RepID=A0ABT8H5Z1_9ACTN|nr:MULTISPECIES: hypothetical protein [Dietzia]MBB0998438.1 hypothetical protein [Dietzia maris]MCY1658554.1 hypothetical protein [Dietzia sp. SL131]MCZ4657748.1 hypothetical protein [Dietzia kunjamensis]MDJ0424256.1 hypothetical protein [Dietzia kunjamensis]MDN4507873.1 hypothetical protein [Dietzia maris]
MRTFAALAISAVIGVVAYALIVMIGPNSGTATSLRIALCAGLAIMDFTLGIGARVRANRPLRSLIPPAFANKDDNSR